MSARMRRAAQAADRRGDTLAPCGHEQRHYFERVPFTYALEGSVLVEVPNPDYRPLLFECSICGDTIQR